MTSASTTLLYQIYHEIWSSSREVIAYALKPICAQISDCLQALSIKFVKFYRLKRGQHMCRWLLFCHIARLKFRAEISSDILTCSYL